MRGNVLGQLLQLLANRIVQRRGAAHHVALDVAAGSQRRKLNLVNAVNRIPEIPLNHAV